MLFHLLYPLSEYVNWFNLFQYLTVRAGGALMTSFLLILWQGPAVIRSFRSWQKGGETVKDILPHHGKAGTPTMGGALVVCGVVTATLLWANLLNPYVWLVLGVLLAYAALGFIDDYLNLTKRWKRGVPGKLRLAVGTMVASMFLVGYVVVNGTPEATVVYLPFFKELFVALGVAGFAAFGILVIVGSANAVNLTDGLDGLVSIPAVITALTLAVLAYIIGRTDFTEYLLLPHIPGAGDVAVVCAAMAGSMLGFLWYNAPPARIFLGDTGSLPVGAMLGAVAVLIKQEFALLIIGGLFVLETVSVVLQVMSFKLTGKRIFRMAPLHHHFEQKGWPESTIVIRFWVISILLAMIGLATIKLR